MDMKIAEDEHIGIKQNKKGKSIREDPSDSDEWVEKEAAMKPESQERDNWMSMTGMLKTYTKHDLSTKCDKKKDKEKQSIDSYNPGTSVRELNPYWKNGGSGLPQSSVSIRQSKPFIKPDYDEDLYSKLSSSREFRKPSDTDNYYSSSSLNSETGYRNSDHGYKPPKDDNYYSSRYKSVNNIIKSRRCVEKNYSSMSYNKSSNWRKESKSDSKGSEYTSSYEQEPKSPKTEFRMNPSYKSPKQSDGKYLSDEKMNKLAASEKNPKQGDGKYLSDEKMNKLAAKIVKAEIMGDTKVVSELKAKLEAARDYRKQNPNAGQIEEERVMLISTNSMGNSRPLTKTSHGDPRSKGGKRKAETHQDGQRQKYFGNDDKYNLAQMFEHEKYGTNYDNNAEFAKIVSKHKNPNDDLEDIFTDEISKNNNTAKDEQKEKERAIKQHARVEKSLDGCEYCFDSKNMLKHLMVSCASKVYVALPARKSLVKGHCIIITIQHTTCITSLDEDVWEEIMDYRKALTQFFNSQNQDVLFFETAMKLHKYPHLVINCVPLPRDVGDMAAIYFKKALLECEAEWSINKKVIDLKGKNVRKCVPKGLPYFWIDFAMDPGFAHIIEDQQLFPKAFAEEIIGGILDLDHNLWKKPQKEQRDQQRQKVIEFMEKWKSFDTVSKR